MAPASVYIGGLPDEITRTELNDHLSIYGKVSALNVHKGYTFVEFESETDASDFVAAYANQLFMGTSCKIELAKQPRRQSKVNGMPRSPEAGHTTTQEMQPTSAGSRVRYPVVVHNLNPQTCWQELKDFGRRTGSTVAFCDIDRANRRRGFLEYYTQGDADRVVKQLDGQELLGHRVTLSSYGKKTLKEEHTRSSRSRSPVASKDMTSGAVPVRSRSPIPTRPAHFRGRSRSPFDKSRHHNAAYQKTGYYHHHHHRQQDRRHDGAHTFYPNGHTTTYPPRHDDRHTRFSTEESVYERMPSHSRSPTRTRRVPDYYDDLSYMTDERRMRIDRLDDEWASYNRTTPSRF